MTEVGRCDRPKLQYPGRGAVIRMCAAVAFAGLLVSCKEPGWAKDEELTPAKPVAGQLPPLPSSYFPPPPTSEEEEKPSEPSEPPPPSEPEEVTVTQVVPPAPAPAPTGDGRTVIEIPIPPELLR